MKRDFFTLTYTDKVLRLAKITGKNIKSVASAEIPAGVVSGGNIKRLKIFAELINELKNIAQPQKISANEVIAAVPEEKVFLKIIEIPKMSIEKVDSTISYQLESLIPFKLAEIYFNWEIIGSKTDKLIILIVVCEKNIIDSLFKVLILAKSKPLVITFPSAGLANLLSRNNKLTIIVNLSIKNSISLIIAKNGKVHFSTSRSMNSDFRGLERIVQDTINYYKQRYVNENISRVLVFGSPELKHIEEKLSKTISGNTKLWHAKDIKIIRNIKKEYIVYMDNLGLNLSLERLSLLPPEIRQNTKNESINYRLASFVNYFIFLIIIILLFYTILWGKLHYDILKVNESYAYLLQNQTTVQQKELDSQIDKFNKKIEILKSIPIKHLVKPDFVRKIISVTDENIILKEITVDSNKNVKIKGLAKNRNDLIIFKDKLNQLDLTNIINLPIIALEKKEDLEFELTTSKK